jgi:2-aminoethylphosphonate-pyruvate transaminase
LQGSGTYAVEAALATLLPRDGKALVLMNGAYGQRMGRILAYLGRKFVPLDMGDYLPPLPDQVEAMLDADPGITHVAVVHCETSSGILNPLEAIAEITQRQGRRLFVDAMSAFGALPVDARELPFDGLVASANKCFEGVPGFGFALLRREALEHCRQRPFPESGFIRPMGVPGAHRPMAVHPADPCGGRLRQRSGSARGRRRRRRPVGALRPQ